MDKNHMPQHLDAPFRVFLLTIDEFLVFLLPILLCLFVLDMPLIGCFLGAGFLLGLKRLKGDQGHYFIQHFAYWHLPQLLPLKVTPPSHIREFIG
jgi:conjugal transfer pilus assembly protein TraL